MTGGMAETGIEADGFLVREDRAQDLLHSQRGRT
jgi:hypothetical protein